MCDYYFDGQPETMFHFEKAVYELLAANADPLVRDSRGNTVLHYLAAGHLGEGDRVGDEQRRLLTVFLQRGVDPKVRNTNGVTALELLFMTGDEPRFEFDCDYDRFYSLGQGLVDAFKQ
jgi:ankyrin repeat protein